VVKKRGDQTGSTSRAAQQNEAGVTILQLKNCSLGSITTPGVFLECSYIIVYTPLFKTNLPYS
jgi:hypothetical protein